MPLQAILHGVDRHNQFLRDLRVAAPGSEQSQHTLFLRGKGLKEQAIGGRSVERTFSIGYRKSTQDGLHLRTQHRFLKHRHQLTQQASQRFPFGEEGTNQALAARLGKGLPEPLLGLLIFLTSSMSQRQQYLQSAWTSSCACVLTGAMTSFPSFASTSTVSPSRIVPSRRLRAIRFSSSRWITRLRGRAPNCGS